MPPRQTDRKSMSETRCAGRPSGVQSLAPLQRKRDVSELFTAGPRFVARNLQLLWWMDGDKLTDNFKELADASADQKGYQIRQFPAHQSPPVCWAVRPCRGILSGGFKPS